MASLALALGVFMIIVPKPVVTGPADGSPEDEVVVTGHSIGGAAATEATEEAPPPRRERKSRAKSRGAAAQDAGEFRRRTKSCQDRA